MKRNTFTADEALIARAREIARAQGRTLDDAFREWLADFVAGSNAQSYEDIMHSLRHVNAGGRFTRDQGNERR